MSDLKEMKPKTKKPKCNKLMVYDKLREFHKNVLIPIMVTEYGFTEWEEEALKTLSGVIYLCEGVFASEDTTKKEKG